MPAMSTIPPHVLLIDDDLPVLSMVSDALVHFGMQVHAFSEGNKALQCLEGPDAPAFDLVISDINMEGMDGFDVINRVKSINPSLPVVLMTGQATLEYAIRAMRMGAANLFQKPLTIRELVNSVFHLVDLHREFRLAEAGLRGLIDEKRHFMFKAMDMDIPSMVRHLTDRLVPMGFAKTTNVDVIAMAFHEALVNALEHGCLELDSSLKGDLFSSSDDFQTMAQARLHDPRYAERAIDVRVHMTPDRYEVVITDGGPGFDSSRISRIDDDSVTRLCGRGLAMIHMVMDEVTHNHMGNEIRLLLRRK
jgi:DNA-binding response OmpR family regulator